MKNLKKTLISILGLDIGSKYIGVAISKKGSFLATPLSSIKRNDNESNDILAIKQLILENDIDVLLIGMPYTLEKKKESDMGIEIRKLSNKIMNNLNNKELKLIFVDERLSSWDTKKKFKKLNLKKGKQPLNIDSMVALQFIENFLN